MLSNVLPSGQVNWQALRELLGTVLGFAEAGGFTMAVYWTHPDAPDRPDFLRLDPKTKKLYCDRCRTFAMEIRLEPVRRQRRTRSAHHRRVVASCRKCREEVVIRYGYAR